MTKLSCLDYTRLRGGVPRQATQPLCARAMCNSKTFFFCRGLLDQASRVLASRRGLWLWPSLARHSARSLACGRRKRERCNVDTCIACTLRIPGWNRRRGYHPRWSALEALEARSGNYGKRARTERGRGRGRGRRQEASSGKHWEIGKKRARQEGKGGGPRRAAWRLGRTPPRATPRYT